VIIGSDQSGFQGYEDRLRKHPGATEGAEMNSEHPGIIYQVIGWVIIGAIAEIIFFLKHKADEVDRKWKEEQKKPEDK
jgi:hypothetical protein